MADLLDKPLIVVTGKGGVGKTTVAAALGLIAARHGKRAIVAEVSRRSDVAGVLGATAPDTFTEHEIADGLFHISIDPEDALAEYLHDQLGSTGLASVLTSSRMFGLLAAATPGLRELLTIGKVWELAQPQRRTPGAKPYDLVIVDAPATGHGVAVLGAPRTFADAAAGGPITRQASQIDATLSDPEQTAVVAVARAEEMPVTETLHLQEALGERLGMRLDAIVVNRLEPDVFAPAEASRMAEHAEHPAVALALHAHARARRQRAQLGRLHKGSGMAPLRIQARRDGPDLDGVADELAAAL
ncbi:MAG: ArsA family ATPase [Solirubrobacteraceae bacterium]|nr:ArsA family ATPase [Solirubrobacteraceae bacterium]